MRTMTPRNWRGWYSCVAVWLLLSGAATALEAQSPATIRLDYLPNLVYDGEVVSVCGTIVNRADDAARARVTCSVSTPTGRQWLDRTRDIPVNGGEESQFEFRLRPAWLSQPLHLDLEVELHGRSQSLPTIIIYPASVNLPELSVQDNHLVDNQGRRAILVVRRQTRERHSRWAVARWARTVVSGGKLDPSSGLLVGDLLARDENRSYVAALKASNVMAEFDFLTVAHTTCEDNAACGILRTVAAFSKSGLARRYDIMLFFLGSEEARFGTDIEEFRRAIDLITGLARDRGTRKVGLIMPAAPAHLTHRTERYQQVLTTLADISGAGLADPQPAVEQAGWGTGRHAGADAHKAIAGSIIEFVREITRE